MASPALVIPLIQQHHSLRPALGQRTGWKRCSETTRTSAPYRSTSTFLSTTRVDNLVEVNEQRITASGRLLIRRYARSLMPTLLPILPAMVRSRSDTLESSDRLDRALLVNPNTDIILISYKSIIYTTQLSVWRPKWASMIVICIAYLLLCIGKLQNPRTHVNRASYTHY